jgi:hypothetical protein
LDLNIHHDRFKTIEKHSFFSCTSEIHLPFVLQNSFYQLHRDEYLYLAEGKHLAWGFMEVPPTLSVMAWISNLFGAGSFWVKLWPALFGAFTFLLVGKTVLSLLFIIWPNYRTTIEI